MSSQGILQADEDSIESGGYFIVDGLEKIFRMTIQWKNNFPIVMKKNSKVKIILHIGYKTRGFNFSDTAVSFKSLA